MAIEGAVNDTYEIHKSDVEMIVRRICVSYSHIRRSFRKSERLISDTLANGDVTTAIQLLSENYLLPNGFVERVGYSAKITAPAALHSQFNSSSGRVIKCTVYFQDSRTALLSMPRYRFLHITAHELAHARMQKDNHPLRTSEFATDILALLVTGDSKGYTSNMLDDYVQYGYIRRELLEEVFRCLGLYADSVYL
jgi:hypothetical protein